MSQKDSAKDQEVVDSVKIMTRAQAKRNKESASKDKVIKPPKARSRDDFRRFLKAKRNAAASND